MWTWYDTFCSPTHTRCLIPGPAGLERLCWGVSTLHLVSALQVNAPLRQSFLWPFSKLSETDKRNAECVKRPDVRKYSGFQLFPSQTLFLILSTINASEERPSDPSSMLEAFLWLQAFNLTASTPATQSSFKHLDVVRLHFARPCFVFRAYTTVSNFGLFSTANCEFDGWYLCYLSLNHFKFEVFFFRETQL